MPYYNGKKVIGVFKGSTIDGVSLSGNNLTIDNTDNQYYVSINNLNDDTILNLYGCNYIVEDHSPIMFLVFSNVEIDTEDNIDRITIGEQYHLTYSGGTISTTNLTPENIKAGVTILGVTGTYTGN